MILHTSMAAAADSIASAARELAEKTMATAGPLENVQLVFRNRSLLTALGAEAAFQVVEKELRSRGMRFAGESEATVRITVTLSENPQEYLWIAEIQRGSGRDLVMITQAKPAIGDTAGPVSKMNLQLKFIIEQSDPVLDIAFAHTGLIVLDPGHLSLYRRQSDSWALENSAVIPAVRNLPRDPRGKLRLSGESIQAYLPSMLCSGSVSPTLAVACEKDESTWPLDQGPAKLESGKNSFVVGNLPVFYSVAPAGSEAARAWIFAGVDGRAILYDDNLKPMGAIPGWGSDLAGIDSACGTGRQVLVSLPGDSSESGSVQAFEVIRNQAVAVTSPVSLPGPVTALWPLSSEEGAVVVARDITSGRYATYQLSVACGR